MSYCRFVGAALAAACLAVPAAGIAQQKQVWKASDVHPLGYPTVEAIVRMGKKLEAQTGGRHSIQIFPAMQPVTKPADLKGMKIRMMGNPLFVETMNAMGGNGVAMGFNELYSALQTGVVDGAENNPPTLLAQNHYQVSKVYSLTGHLIIPEIFVFSKRNWETLPKADQELVKKLSREAQLEQRQLWDAYVGEAESKLKAAGIQFVSADKEAFYKATQPVRDKYGAKYSALLKRIQDTQ